MAAPVEFDWFLPTRGDGADVGPATTDRGHNAAALRRRPTLEYLGAVAQAEQAGFAAVLTPTGSGCEDAWVVCAALVPLTSRLHFLVAFRPGFVLPTLAAQQAASFQRLSGGRLRLNIVTGGDPVEQRAYGDFLDHDERYARTGEFLEVLTRSLAGERFDVDGVHVRAENAGLTRPPDVVPPVYLGGASPAAEEVTARWVDRYLTWGEPPAMVAPRLDRVREKAAAHGRTVRFGMRLHVVTRDTPEEAWAHADRMLAGIPASAIAATQERFARMDSVGQARMASLHGGTATAGARSLEVAPNLWAGIGLVREGAGTALVGSHEQVAERLAEYAALGIEEFVLSGYPHLEEAWRVGEEVLPLLGATRQTAP